MGQLSLNNPELYFEQTLKDLDGNSHATIRENIVILEAGSGQLSNLPELFKSENEKIDYVLFSKIGQNLSNNFDEYYKIISQSSTKETEVIGIGLRGEYETIKKLTKKFSIAK
jgi:hypothetical protein